MPSALIPARRGYPAVRLAAQPVNRRPVRHGPLVLVPVPRKFPAPAIDRDRTVSRRSEPSSRATLMGEQPNPWDLLLSFERRPFHAEPPDHYAPVSCLCGLSASQSSALVPLHSKAGYQSAGGHLWKPPLRFWRRPPQSNYPPNAVREHVPLAPGQPEGRISTAAPRILAYPIHSLRPILHTGCPGATLSCSKGSRGLFVPSRVIGIFTDTTISLGPRLRQCPDHYTIRAGRNLPDKEFRYLRTVIVTAVNLPAPGRCQAVYFDFRIRTALCFW